MAAMRLSIGASMCGFCILGLRSFPEIDMCTAWRTLCCWLAWDRSNFAVASTFRFVHDAKASDTIMPHRLVLHGLELRLSSLLDQVPNLGDLLVWLLGYWGDQLGLLEDLQLVRDILRALCIQVPVFYLLALAVFRLIVKRVTYRLYASLQATLAGEARLVAAPPEL
eukprot:975571-Amphidinium_carterae.1